MKLLRKVTSKVSHGVSSTSTSTGSQNVAQPRLLRSGIEIAGVFIFVGVVALAGAQHSKQLQNTAQTSSKPASLNLETDQSVTPTPAADQASASAAGGSTSTSVTSSTNGTGSTQVTVNGQPVSVPANGTTSSTVTSPDGSRTSITVSNGQSTTGSANNFSSSYSNVHTYTSTNSYRSGQ